MAQAGLHNNQLADLDFSSDSDEVALRKLPPECAEHGKYCEGNVLARWTVDQITNELGIDAEAGAAAMDILGHWYHAPMHRTRWPMVQEFAFYVDSCFFHGLLFRDVFLPGNVETTLVKLQLVDELTVPSDAPVGSMMIYRAASGVIHQRLACGCRTVRVVIKVAQTAMRLRKHPDLNGATTMRYHWRMHEVLAAVVYQLVVSYFRCFSCTQPPLPPTPTLTPSEDVSRFRHKGLNAARFQLVLQSVFRRIQLWDPLFA